MNERSSLWGGLWLPVWTRVDSFLQTVLKSWSIKQISGFQVLPSVILFLVRLNFISTVLAYLFIYMYVLLFTVRSTFLFNIHTHFPGSAMSFGYFSHLQPAHCFLSLSLWCRTFIISVREAAAASICVQTLPFGVREGGNRKGRRGQSLLRDEIGEEEEGVAGRAEIERVVSPLTVTESGPLSCCQEKYTEAGINCTLTLFLFVPSSPLAPLLPPLLPPLFALSLHLFSLKFRQRYVSLRFDGKRQCKCAFCYSIRGHCRVPTEGRKARRSEISRPFFFKLSLLLLQILTW